MSNPQSAPPDLLKELLGELVVVDTDAHYLYMGRLEAADRDFLKLAQADVHEITKAGLSKERYAHEAKAIGVRPNRKYTWVNRARVISVSRLEDIESFASA